MSSCQVPKFLRKIKALKETYQPRIMTGSLLLFLGYHKQSVPAAFSATLTSLDKEVAQRQAGELVKAGVYCLAIVPGELDIFYR